MRKLVCYGFVFSIVILSGCWDFEEAERMDYIHGVAVDYKDGKVLVSIQVVNLGNLGQAETGGGTGTNENQAVTARETSDSVIDAIFQIYRSSQRRLYWGHLTFLVVTEDALKHGLLKDAIDAIDRFRETRYRIFVFATQDDDVDKIFEATAVFDGSPVYSRVTDLSNTYEQDSFVYELTLRDFLLQIKEPGYNAIIPAITTTEKTWTSVESVETMVRVVGVALLDPDNALLGFLNGTDIAGLRWLKKDAVRNEIQAIDDNGEIVGEAVVIRPSFSIKPKVKNDEVTFDIEVKGKVIVHLLQKNVELDELKKKFQEQIEKEVYHTYQKALEYQADIYRLSEVLYRKDVKTWKKINKNGQVPLHENSIKVTAKLTLSSSKLDDDHPIMQTK